MSILRFFGPINTFRKKYNKLKSNCESASELSPLILLVWHNYSLILLTLSTKVVNCKIREKITMPTYNSYPCKVQWYGCCDHVISISRHMLYLFQCKYSNAYLGNKTQRGTWPAQGLKARELTGCHQLMVSLTHFLEPTVLTFQISCSLKTFKYCNYTFSLHGKYKLTICDFIFRKWVLYIIDNIATIEFTLKKATHNLWLQCHASDYAHPSAACLWHSDMVIFTMWWNGQCAQCCFPIKQRHVNIRQNA